VGNIELDGVLSQREQISDQIKHIVDSETDKWGIDVENVKIQNIELPQDMKRAMAKQAEAERERRAKVINAEGEFQAAQRLADAALIIEQHPVALQLRYLQTLAEVATENNSTTLFPLPIDLLSPFLQKS
jgi:regulator of protease activity HflC (stomatin/prohibitin superfamily)